jgi:outer membrane protein
MRRGGCTSAHLIACTMAFWLVAGTPQAARSETLQEALTLAYQSNPKLDAQRAVLRATDEGVPQAKAGYRPTAAATANLGFQNQISNPTQLTDGRSHPLGAGVTVTQSVFSGFRTVNTVREAESNVRAGRETLRLIESQVLLDGVTAYADVLRDLAIVRLREKNVAVLTADLESATARRGVREVTRTDVAQTESRRARGIAALDVARSNLKASRANYERVIGRPPDRLTEPTPPNKLIPGTIDDVFKIAERENPNVVGALYREEAARYEVDRIWGELLPEAHLQAGYNEGRNPAFGIDTSRTATVQGVLTVPLYEGGETKARVRAAKHTHVSTLQQIEQARTETRATAAAAWAKLESTRAQVAEDGKIIASSRVALEGVREEYRVGQRTTLDVLNAEQDLVDSEVQAAVDRHDNLVAAYGLLASIGRLNGSSLQLGDTQYDPSVHYDEVQHKWFGISITHADGRVELIERLDDWGAGDPYASNRGLRATVE